MAGRSNLAWTNITRADLRPQAQEAWDMFLAAKAELEQALKQQAITDEHCTEEDTLKYAYGSIGQGSIGVAVAEPEKAQRKSGFAGLKRPAPKGNLSDWQNGQDSQGYRR